MSKTRQIKIRSLTAKFSSGHCIDWHSHKWIQLVFATSGVMHLQDNRNTWIVPAHRAVWIPAGVSHFVKMFGTVSMRTLYFHPSMNVFVSDKCLAVNVSNLMRELIVHISEVGIVIPNSIEKRSLIQFTVCQAKKMEAEPLMLPMPKDRRAYNAAKSLLANPAQSLPVVANENAASLRTLQRIFLIETGLSLGRWRSQARLFSSLPLLGEGRRVTEVSLDIGFESLSAFISAFRKFFGVTPGKYFQNKPIL